MLRRRANSRARDSAAWDASARGTWKLGCGESALLGRGHAGEEGWAGVEELGQPEHGKGREVMTGGPRRSDSEWGCANECVGVGTEADVWAVLCQ